VKTGRVTDVDEAMQGFGELIRIERDASISDAAQGLNFGESVSNESRRRLNEKSSRRSEESNQSRFMTSEEFTDRARRRRRPARLGIYVQRTTSDQEREYNTANDERKAEIIEILQSEQGQKAIAGGAPLSALRIARYRMSVEPSEIHFRNVGYCLFALLFGYGGGHFAAFVYRRQSS
jgi:hypothetical protein